MCRYLDVTFDVEQKCTRRVLFHKDIDTKTYSTISFDLKHVLLGSLLFVIPDFTEK